MGSGIDMYNKKNDSLFSLIPSYSYDFTAIIVHIKLDLLYYLLCLFLLSWIITKLTLCSENSNNCEKVTKICFVKTTKAYQEDKVLNSL